MGVLSYGIYILISSSILGRDKPDLSTGSGRIPLMTIDHSAVALKKSMKVALKALAVGVACRSRPDDCSEKNR